MEKKFKKELAGTLGDKYLFSLDVYTKSENPNICNIRLKLSPALNPYLYIDTLIDSIYEVIFKLKVNNRVILFESREIDLKYFNNSIAINVPFEIDPIGSNNLDIKASLYVCSNQDSNYIGSSFIDERVFISNESNPKYTILLDRDELNFSILTLNDFDFIEYKLNDNFWKKLPNKKFSLLDEDLKNKNYIQVRGKAENNYYYSNVIKF